MNILPAIFFILCTTFCTPYDDAHTAVLDFLDTVHHQVLIAAYSITDPDIIDKLIVLHQNGVDVEIITDKVQAAGEYERDAIMRLEQYHIKVFVGKSLYNQLVHVKFMEADDQESIDGSYNFTRSANYQDNVLHVDHDPVLAKQLHVFWDKIKEDLR